MLFVEEMKNEVLKIEKLNMISHLLARTQSFDILAGDFYAQLATPNQKFGC
jgi:hypothetical protein